MLYESITLAKSYLIILYSGSTIARANSLLLLFLKSGCTVTQRLIKISLYFFDRKLVNNV